MAYTFQVTFDSSDPHKIADWWADALGWVKEPTDEAFIQGLVDAGHASIENTTHYQGRLVWKVGAAITHPDGLDKAPRILFQLVPEPKTVKNRVHLDVRVGDEDIEAVTSRLIAVGARFQHRGEQGPSRWITITDPEGNELCITH